MTKYVDTKDGIVLVTKADEARGYVAFCWGARYEVSHNECNQVKEGGSGAVWAVFCPSGAILERHTLAQCWELIAGRARNGADFN